MGKFDYDPSKSLNISAFQRLSSGRAGSVGRENSSGGCLISSSRHSIFNQVQVLGSSMRRPSLCVPGLEGLHGAVDDLRASAATLAGLSENSREVLEANVGASVASVKEVEAAASLADDLGRRIIEDDLAATEAQADKLTPELVHRLLRS